MDRTAKIWMTVAVVLFIVILVLTYLLFAIPSAPVVHQATSTPVTKVTPKPEPTPTDQPLSKLVTVTTPQPQTTVGGTFAVAGKAPGNWFFEASFPIQVRDKDGGVIAHGHASAQGEWMTTNLVSFTATVNIDSAYKGPATLILLRDNPSGLPENDDAVEIPIVIQ